MKRMAKGTFLATLTSVAVIASLAVIATPAYAINKVACNRDDFVWVYYHTNAPLGSIDVTECLANAGEIKLGDGLWLHRIWTGNNRVQWWGDGRYQPAEPIPKWADFRFPNHPGGVNMSWIKIV